MKTFLDIIKEKKAHLIELRTKLKDHEDYYKQCDDFGFIEIHGMTYLTILSILLKQEQILDEVIADYYAQEEEDEYLKGCSPGKEV